MKKLSAKIYWHAQKSFQVHIIFCQVFNRFLQLLGQKAFYFLSEIEATSFRSNMFLYPAKDESFPSKIVIFQEYKMWELSKSPPPPPPPSKQFWPFGAPQTLSPFFWLECRIRLVLSIRIFSVTFTTFDHTWVVVTQ